MNPEGKRAAIMASGERLFAAQGYASTAMAEIAREAGVAVGTVYRLFPDKLSLLIALHAAMEARFLAAMQSGWLKAEAFPDRFAPMLAALFAECDAVKETIPLYAMTGDMIASSDYVPGARMIAAIEAMYAEGVAGGSFRPLPQGMVGPVSHAMVEGGLRAFIAQPTEAYRRQLEKEMSDLFRRAFVR